MVLLSITKTLGARFCAHVAVALLILGCSDVTHADGPHQSNLRNRETRIAPEGLPGHLILCGTGPVSENAIKFFTTALPKKDVRVVVLVLTKQAKQARDILTTLKSQKSLKQACFSLVSIRGAKNARLDAQKLTKALRGAHGVWLADMSGAEDLTDGEKRTILSQAKTVLKRGGVLGSSGTATLWLANKHLHGAKTDSEEPTSGLGLFPDSIFALARRKKSEPGLASVIKDNPGSVGYELGNAAGLYLRGRRFWVLSGKITVYLAASKTWPAKQMVLEKSRRYTDLTTLRRSARARAGTEFPPQKPQRPIVKKGTLIIVGGGGTPKGLFQKFVELAGGKKAKLLILPTAQPDPISNQSRLAGLFQKYGAKTVTVLPGRKRDVVESPKYIKAFQEATGIWFGGGRQWRFVDAYRDTKVHLLMHKVLERNGVIMGSSAGASIQGEYMARGAVYGNLNIVAEGYERGLGFLKGVAIDQHFSQRGRLKDMNYLVTKYPQLLGIGIDESTAIIVRKSLAEVVGKGKVYFYDAKLPRTKDGIGYVAIESTKRYDLVKRTVLNQDSE
ncbi:MAG: cyanophycinase [Gemmataceae bacterium]